MRVNPNSIQNAQANGTQSAKKTDKSKSSEGVESSNRGKRVSTEGSVKADISSRAKDMARAKQVAQDAPDVREAKIAAIKAQIQNKQYNVSAEAISDKLVDDHMSSIA
jgi:negative regulator of flagellin synthesis FlgM